MILARQRFLTADNATIAVISNTKNDVVYRAVRRYFGAWEKSDKKVPATFRQPDAPQTGLFIKDSTIENTSELRFAFRNVARNNKDFYASEVLAKILQKRLQTKEGSNTAVVNNAHLLNGSVELNLSKWNVGQIVRQNNQITSTEIDTFIKNLLNSPIKQEEFETANTSLVPPTINDRTNLWLDVDTFKLVSVKDELQKANEVTMADVQRVAEKMLKEPMVSVLLIKSEEKK